MVRLRVLSKGSGRARRVVLSAAAKVNLALEVLGKRPDGYHELATVMQAVDLSDRLVLEDADDLELVSRAPGVPTDATNLAWRAAVALREAARLGRGVRITLDKRIPVAGGGGRWRRRSGSGGRRAWPRGSGTRSSAWRRRATPRWRRWRPRCWPRARSAPRCRAAGSRCSGSRARSTTPGSSGRGSRAARGGAGPCGPCGAPPSGWDGRWPCEG